MQLTILLICLRSIDRARRPAYRAVIRTESSRKHTVQSLPLLGAGPSICSTPRRHSTRARLYQSRPTIASGGTRAFVLRGSSLPWANASATADRYRLHGAIGRRYAASVDGGCVVVLVGPSPARGRRTRGPFLSGRFFSRGLHGRMRGGLGESAQHPRSAARTRERALGEQVSEVFHSLASIPVEADSRTKLDLTLDPSRGPADKHT